MEAIVYRQSTARSWTEAWHTCSMTEDRRSASVPASPPEPSVLSPAVFYPLVTEQERSMWTHWLPTFHVFERTGALSLAEVLKVLTRLKAPPEVVVECRWTWTMALFEAYEVRTPVRRDARDPLLLGRCGRQWYRLALWGESLRPLEEITALVHQSLGIKARAAKRRAWLGLGGILPGLALLAWLGAPLLKGQPVSAGLLCTCWLFCAGYFVLLSSTPENCQQDFLDRYRR